MYSNKTFIHSLSIFLCVSMMIRDAKMAFNCELCALPTDYLTLLGSQAICSMRCYETLRLAQPLEEEATSSKCKPDDRVLSVRGRGEVKVTPDRVRITLVVIRRAKTVSEVNQLLINNADKLIDLLKNKTEGRAEKLQTEDLIIEPIYKEESEEERVRRRGEREIIAYEGTFPISFEALITHAGPLIDLALKDDYASSVQGLRYIVSDAISKPAYTEALRLASHDAEAQAQVVLDALNLKKRHIIRVNIQDTGNSVQAYRAEESYASFSSKSRLAKASANTQLIAPENEVTALVTIELSYL